MTLTQIIAYYDAHGLDPNTWELMIEQADGERYSIDHIQGIAQYEVSVRTTFEEQQEVRDRIIFQHNNNKAD